MDYLQSLDGTLFGPNLANALQDIRLSFGKCCRSASMYLVILFATARFPNFARFQVLLNSRIDNAYGRLSASGMDIPISPD
jgi:hypothetical protein